ncbi:MAG: ABC transporter permease [Desulfobulbaceae bacterium]|nr:ABC transporter permease [Desulfobulbaceae bacterium]
MEWKIVALAQKNLRRKIFRSIAIIATVMVVAATLFSVTTIMDSVEQSLKRGTARLGADIMVVPAKSESAARSALLSGKPSTFYMDKSLVEQIKAIHGVRSVTSQIFLKTSPYACCDISDLFLIGFDPENDFTIKPWLTNTLGRPLAADEVIMGRGITAYATGFTLNFYNQPFTIVGMLEETGMEFIDNAIFISYAGIDRILANAKKDGTMISISGNQVSTVLVQVDPELSPDRVAVFIQAKLDGVKAIVTDRIIASVRKQLFILLRSVLSVSAILWVMALLLVGVVFSMIVNERRRELGIFRAMGAKKSHIFRLIMLEAAILSFLGGLIGIGLGGGVLYMFKEAIYTSLNIPHLWPNTARFVGLISFCMLLSLLTGVIAALGPAIRAAMLEPYEAVRGGE